LELVKHWIEKVDPEGQEVKKMNSSLGETITKQASSQTYYTIRFLVDRERVEDAFRAYGYFRWVDDVLDSDGGTAASRQAFLERQAALLESCYRGELPREVEMQEEMLVELVKHDQEKNSALQSYLRNMMAVMRFDARRRGTLVSQAELNEYTRWLSIAVIDALRYFIGHDEHFPRDETRYLAVSAAHIIHMLRDSYDDVQAGYFNFPREVLDAYAISPFDIDSPACCKWVREQIELAREYFRVGKLYFYRVRNLRHRLAGIAYIARFEWLLETIEREGFILRRDYPERKSLRTALKMAWLTLVSSLRLPSQPAVPMPAASKLESEA
jgi:phytoene/squalene synthetase